MSGSSYIQSIIICDEVRTEIGGKDIAIGIYNGHIVVPQIPFVIPMLAIRHEFDFRGTECNTMKLKLEDPNGSPIFQRGVKLGFQDWSKPGAATVNLEGLILTMEGRYKFYVRFGAEWEQTRTLLVEKFDKDRMLTIWRANMQKMEEKINVEVPDADSAED